MPDIAMCLNNDCPLKKDCYRFCAIPSHTQYYVDFKFDENGECDDFVKLAKSENE